MLGIQRLRCSLAALAATVNYQLAGEERGAAVGAYAQHKPIGMHVRDINWTSTSLRLSSHVALPQHHRLIF